MRDFIPLGLGIQTSGPNSEKHQLLKISCVSFQNGSRFQTSIRHADFNIDIDHCKDFLPEIGKDVGRDLDIADEELNQFLIDQSKVLLEDRPITRIMKMIPMGTSINKTLKFIEKTLPKTFDYMSEDSIDISSLFAVDAWKEDSELTYVQSQYRNRAELKLHISIPDKVSDSTLEEAYLSCYVLGDFLRESPTWMHS